MMNAQDPILLTALGLAHFLMSWAGWCVFWRIRPKGTDSPSAGQPFSVAIPAILALGALAVFWTGLVFGGAVPGAADAVMPSLMEHLFHSTGEDASAFGVASAIVWGGSFLGLLAAFWSSGRGEDRWQRFGVAFPRAGGFIGEGYGTDILAARALNGIFLTGSWLERWVDRRFWQGAFPQTMVTVLVRVSRLAAGADDRLRARIDRGTHRTVHVPAKFLQLVQSGDVQWYLFFAVGSGIALLLHFLRF